VKLGYTGQGIGYMNNGEMWRFKMMGFFFFFKLSFLINFNMPRIQMVLFIYD